MRYVSPSRSDLSAAVFERAPLDAWREYSAFLQGAEFPAVEQLDAAWKTRGPWRFARQDETLLADGLHYEQRIFHHGVIATRPDNWHDLFNALIWLRHSALKAALNARQVAEITLMGPKQRSRAQCALTHFDEAGAIVIVRDEKLFALWDAHDWHGLFWREREAWADGRIQATVFGHAILEHALSPQILHCAKAIAVYAPDADVSSNEVNRSVASAIADGQLLCDPQESRPMPMSGIPGFHSAAQDEVFYREAACFRPVREGRKYRTPLTL
jgi:hypothetical protein